MNSSGSTELLASTSTRSIAIVGISASMTRRRELANARSTFLKVKSTEYLAALQMRVSGHSYVALSHTYPPHELLLEARYPPASP